MQLCAPLMPHIMPCIHQASIMPWLTFAPGRLKPKKGPLGTSLKNCERSASTPARKPSNTEMGKPPGFLSLWAMIGGTALTSTALLTRLLP